MILVDCPRCGDNVLAPSGVSPAARVRCPLCMDEFELSEAMAQLPPELIVLEPVMAELNSAASTASTSAAASGFSIDTSSPAPEFKFEQGSAPVRPQVEIRQPEPINRPKKVVFEIFKVVLGGLLGLTIGQILLWRLPGDWPTHQRDPFQVGEKYGHVFPVSFLAPESVRDPGAVTLSKEGEAIDWEADMDSANVPLDDDSADSTDDEPSLEDDDPADSATGAAGTAAELPELPGVRFPPRITGGQLDAAVQSSLAIATAMNGVSANSPAVKSQLVDSLRRVARSVTFIQPTRSVPQAIEAKLQEFLPQFAAAEFRSLLFRGDAEQAGDAFAGELIVGEVTHIQLNGQLFQTTFRLDGGELLVLSVEDPREKFTIGDSVLMLGVWITDPQTQLAGYETVEPPVLFGEFAVRLVTQNPSPSTAGPPEPAPGKPAPDKPVNGQPSADQPSNQDPADEPSTDEPSSDEPSTDEPSSGEAATDEPGTEEARARES